jgi:deoxyribodipyrimidine photo-lyase
VTPGNRAEPSTAVLLFTRDLRLRDHPALNAALDAADRVVPTFVLDEELLGGPCGAPNRVTFLVESLDGLERALRERGSRLVIRRGDVVAEAIGVARETGAGAIFMSSDVSAYAQRRERRLRSECEGERIALRTLPGVAVVAPGEIVPAGGDHYRVFTPYWRAWSEVPKRRPLAAPRRLPAAPAIRSDTRAMRDLARAGPSSELPPGGEDAGRRRLESWVRRGLSDYDARRDDLGGDATSRLSAYLHFGCVSATAVLARIGRRPAGHEFARQLCWRDFHHQVMAARPEIAWADYRPRGDRWRRDPADVEAWRRGRTGYPIVDAGMRQLEREGFMHNRARLITASFLTKLLYVDWRIGARHFAERLVDADLACNIGNWQWVAGTGNDTRPNRLLNPIRQAHRYDPDGEYVRRYVPELSSITGPAVHRPWLAEPPGGRRPDYPPPIVDYGSAADEFRHRRAEASPSSP